MKTLSVIKAAKKAGLEVVQDGNRIEIKSANILGGFIDQNGFAICLNTIRKSDIAAHKPQYDERCDRFHYSIKDFVANFN